MARAIAKRRRTRRSRRHEAALCALAWVGAAGSTVAEPAQHAPLPDPAQTERAFDLLRREQGPVRKPPVALPQIARPETQADTTPIVTLRSVSLEGNRTIDTAALASLYEGYIGRRISQADLLAMAAAISDVYRRAGWHLSRAIIPPQDIKEGHVRIRLIEGRIAEVHARGEGAVAFGAQALLAPVASEPTSRLQTLERQLMLVNDRPGIRVADSVLEEIGEATGEFRLIVQVDTWRAFAATTVDNLGATATGRTQFFAVTALNSVFAPGDALTADVYTNPVAPRELRYGRLSYDVPLGTDGFRVGASVWQGAIFPNDDRRSVHTDLDSKGFELRGSIVPLQTQKSSLRLTVSAGGAEFISRDDLGRNYDDRLRTLTFAADSTFEDAAGGQDYLSLRLRQGMGGSVAGDPLLSRVGASGIFTAGNLGFVRLQELSEAWSFMVAGAGQVASGPLLVSQQFYLGAAAFGRGYDLGRIGGDHGVAGTAELRFDHNLGLDVLKSIQLYGFLDSGAAWLASSYAGALSLTSAGAGVRFRFAGGLQAGLAVAVPIASRTLRPERHAPRLLFSISETLKVCPERARMQCPWSVPPS